MLALKKTEPSSSLLKSYRDGVHIDQTVLIVIIVNKIAVACVTGWAVLFPFVAAVSLNAELEFCPFAKTKDQNHQEWCHNDVIRKPIDMKF